MVPLFSGAGEGVVPVHGPAVRASTAPCDHEARGTGNC